MSAPPTEFNERFTIRRDAEGRPAGRPLREKTGDEVLAAMWWHDSKLRG